MVRIILVPVEDIEDFDNNHSASEDYTDQIKTPVEDKFDVVADGENEAIALANLVNAINNNAVDDANNYLRIVVTKD